MASPTFLYPIIAEFIITCTTLCLFLCGYPDTTRRCLWAEGGVHHFNSDPRLRIYFYANHLEPPPIPYIWSQTFTDLNLGTAFLAFWVCLTRLLLARFAARNRSIDLFLQSCIISSWILSFASQLSRDFSDEHYKSLIPWYLSHSCTISRPQNAWACHVAQASFVFTFLCMCLAVATFCLALVTDDEEGNPKLSKKKWQLFRYHEEIEYVMLDSQEEMLGR